MAAWPWWAGVGAAVLAGAGLAAAMGALATRTRGIYFAMVTLALSQCVYYAAYQATGLTGGENGLRGINLQRIGPLDFLDPTTRCYVAACLRHPGAVRRCPASSPPPSARRWRRCGRTRRAPGPAGSTCG